MKPIIWISAVLAMFLAYGASATDWSGQPLTCALCGMEYESSFPVAYSSGGGMRLDFQPMGSSAAPWPLGACPACGFIQYTHELTAEEKAILDKVVRSEEYKKLIETRPSYYRLAKLFEALGKDGCEIGDAYLKASWQEERRKGLNDLEIRDCLEACFRNFTVYLAEQAKQTDDAPPEKGCVSNPQMVRLLKAEILRRLRHFETALGYLDQLDKLPESRQEPSAEILRFQKQLCAAEDSRPQFLHMREKHAQSLVVCRAALPDASSSDFPVRWTAAVELENLEEVDAALDKPLRKLEMVPSGATDKSQMRLVQTGREWLAARKEGFFALDTLDQWIEEDFVFHFMPMLLLRDHARSSRISHVKDFEFSDDLARQLPVTIHPTYDRELSAAILQGRGFPGLPRDWEARFGAGDLPLASPIWPRFAEAFDDVRTVVNTPRLAQLIAGSENNGGEIIALSHVAWADFNADGVEDLLLTSSARSLGSNDHVHRLVMLTRLEPEGRLMELPLPEDRTFAMSFAVE